MKTLQMRLKLKKMAVLVTVLSAAMAVSPAFTAPKAGQTPAIAAPQGGRKPAIDCSKIRGVCYGIRPEETVRRELAYGSRVGLNTVRFWLSRGFSCST